LPQLFTITDEWNEQPWFSTGGTRAKKYLQSPDGKFYYFKRSQYKDATDSKPGKDFTYEFWSEVIAYEVGSTLGFNVLKYDIALSGELMGCICESMINAEEEELIEGVKYLQAFAPGYDPKSKEHQNRYTFQMIENSLEKAKLKGEIENIIEMIVFDSLIGNGDRHQENWAVINHQKLMTQVIEEAEQREGYQKIKKWQRWLLSKYKNLLRFGEKGYYKRGWKPAPTYYISTKKFAPIYDSGSRLGRELIAERAEVLAESKDELNRYIDKGFSEIHWEGRKINHFELVGNLLESTLYNEIVKTIINRVLEKWDGPKIEQIVKEIDRLVPESHSIYKIPDSRKLLIFKIITLRRNRLATLIHERI